MANQEHVNKSKVKDKTKNYSSSGDQGFLGTIYNAIVNLAKHTSGFPDACWLKYRKVKGLKTMQRGIYVYKHNLQD